MRKILCAVYVMGCVLVSSTLAKITYIDAELDNTTINGDAPAHLVNCTITTDRASDDDFWAFRTDRSDMTGEGIWVTDGGSFVGDYEDTAPLKVDITLPVAGVSYDLYAVIMNNNSGTGDWDVSTRIGDTGDFTDFNKNSEVMSQALASDFVGDVTVSGGGDMTMKVLIGQYTPTVDDETVSIYINGLDTWQDGNSHDQRTRFDGVGYETTPPYVISPYDGEIDVETPTVLLEWGGGQDPNATGHYVYLAKDSDPLTCLNPTSALSVTAGEYSYSPTVENATYYWQVEVAMDTGSGSYGDPNNILGPVWSFLSTLSKPIINSGPDTQILSLGDTAVFSLDWESLSTPTFAWYKSTDPNNNTPADDTLQTNDEMLSISTVALADEGYYYCLVNNDSGVEVASQVAGLAIAREMAHWSLDADDYVSGQYQDLSGEGHHADPNWTPTFVSGQLDEGVSILRADGSEEPTTNSWASAGTWNPSEFSNQLTVVFWMKWAGQSSTDGEQVIVGKRSSDNLGGATLWQVTRPGSNSNNDLWFQSTQSNIQVSNILTQDQWQQIAVTFNGTTGVVYSNGEIKGSGSFALGDNEDAINAMICLGGSNFDNNPGKWMNGVLDDVQIYNYAFTDVEVAEAFVDASPGSSVCVASLKPEGKYDLNDDCIIDISDFAELAASWLDCGLIPKCSD